VFNDGRFNDAVIRIILCQTSSFHSAHFAFFVRNSRRYRRGQRRYTAYRHDEDESLTRPWLPFDVFVQPFESAHIHIVVERIDADARPVAQSCMTSMSKSDMSI
jgi:hypothetical protein